MNGSPTDLPLSEFAKLPPGNDGWRWRRMLFFILLAFVAHVALIFSFGTKKPIIPRPARNDVPELRLASGADALIELQNPALFALPNSRDFASPVWLKMPAVTIPAFGWTEAPRWLPLTSQDLGMAFKWFMSTNTFPVAPLNFKSTPQFVLPASALASALPTNSTLQISPGLAARDLLFQPDFPMVFLNDVAAPSRVRIVVDANGDVISAILLAAGNSLEVAGHSDDANAKALVLARSLRFKSAAHLTFGEVTFYWHTVPIISTNTP